MNDESESIWKEILFILLYENCLEVSKKTRGSFPGSKAPGPWSWPLTSI